LVDPKDPRKEGARHSFENLKKEVSLLVSLRVSYSRSTGESSGSSAIEWGKQELMRLFDGVGRNLSMRKRQFMS